MGTRSTYPQHVPKEKWKPEGEILTRLEHARNRYREIDAIMAEVKEIVSDIADPTGPTAAPVNALAEFFSVQRKTIYRWMGQEMT
jgi:hypothetical protein